MALKGIYGGQMGVCDGRRGWGHRLLTKYAKLRVAHVPGMPGTFSPPQRVSDPDKYPGTSVMHVP